MFSFNKEFPTILFEIKPKYNRQNIIKISEKYRTILDIMDGLWRSNYGIKQFHLPNAVLHFGIS